MQATTKNSIYHASTGEKIKVMRVALYGNGSESLLYLHNDSRDKVGAVPNAENCEITTYYLSKVN